MSLQIGQQLGSYEITSLIGKGGMGEVYRARDSRLKRHVAIKILPSEFARDTDRVVRFQRRRQALVDSGPELLGVSASEWHGRRGRKSVLVARHPVAS